MPSSVTDWVTSLLTVGLIAVSAAYCVVSTLIARARRRRGLSVPGVYPGSRRQAGDMSLAWWAVLPTEAQEEMDDLVLGPGARLREAPGEAEDEDEAFLNRAEQARVDAKYDAAESAAHLAHRAQVNALYRP